MNSFRIKVFFHTFLLSFVLSLNNLVFSQNFEGGLTAGFTASQVDGDSYAGFDKLGFRGGVFINRILIGNLGARLELCYSSRGARNEASDDNTGNYKLTLHYIDLPVIATLNFKKYGSFELGLIPGYLFSSGGEDEEGKIPDDYLVDFHKFDLGTLIGININLLPKTSLGLRYSYSIFSIRDLETAGSYYSWFGKIFGNSRGDFNNYITLSFNYRLK